MGVNPPCNAAGVVTIDETDSRWTAYLAQQAAKASSNSYLAQLQAQIGKGVAVTSTNFSATLNGTYPIDSATQLQTVAVVTSILLNGTATDGGSTVSWLDSSGVPHTFTISQFKTFATAVAAYVTSLSPQVVGPPGNHGWPSAAIAIP
jgi:hypothetical protein